MTSRKFTVPDLPHYFVVDEGLHRGAQPTPRGFEILRDQGLKTVINLRDEQPMRIDEAEIIRSLGMTYVSIDMDPFLPAPDEKIEKFLKVVTDTKNSPSFVHCLHGQDRTGMMVGIYRMVVHGFEYQQAFEEMCALGFHREFVNLEKSARRWEGRKL
ncbi:MAG: tyrosine-protein phosphatase [Cyanobacteria bacterium SZAS LIN-2]|nr:tyrosine-protein phosphatase [Cyanobacteria bacterium SZAS LIN-3]MBS1995038.1 tyrosine-protein phosphatase [Cyanobacteria bacterium SZAS LIN-2]MBS2010070.1 tyrosine-protein phosphatase [Cyanobacteria bacterium SZAS TMP-1]